MNKKKLGIGVVVLCSVALVYTAFTYLRDKGGDTEMIQEEGVRAPAFTLPDTWGETISLEDIEGKIRILNLWASWSPYSAEELAMFERVQREYASDVSVIALSRDNNPEDGKNFVKEKGFSESIIFVYDKNDAYFKEINGFAVPETLFLNEDGTIVYHKRGPITYDEVVEVIEQELQTHAGN